MTDTLLHISIVVSIIGNVLSVSVGVFVALRYIFTAEKRLKAIEKFIGKTNNLNRNK